MPVFGLGFETWGAELNKLQFGLLQELSLFKNVSLSPERLTAFPFSTAEDHNLGTECRVDDEARVAWRQVFKDAFVQRAMAFAEWWKV
eukprot:182147-Rhodomonas_salina.1